jgi:hypothetical protein
MAAPTTKAKTRSRLRYGIRLANKFDKIVLAVSVGNEILVSWSDHRLTEEQATAFVEQVRRSPCTARSPKPTISFTGSSRRPSSQDHVDFITHARISHVGP